MIIIGIYCSRRVVLLQFLAMQVPRQFPLQYSVVVLGGRYLKHTINYGEKHQASLIV